MSSARTLAIASFFTMAQFFNCSASAKLLDGGNSKAMGEPTCLVSPKDTQGTIYAYEDKGRAATCAVKGFIESVKSFGGGIEEAIRRANESSCENMETVVVVHTAYEKHLEEEVKSGKIPNNEETKALIKKHRDIAAAERKEQVRMKCFLGM